MQYPPPLVAGSTWPIPPQVRSFRFTESVRGASRPPQTIPTALVVSWAQTESLPNGKRPTAAVRTPSHRPAHGPVVVAPPAPPTCPPIPPWPARPPVGVPDPFVPATELP